MLKIEKILFPVDFSDRSRDAAHAAVALAKQFQAEVIMLHVVETYKDEARLAGYDVEVRVGKSRDALAQFMLPEFGQTNVRRVVETGDVARQIAAAAASEKADLIMMPTHGYGPFRRFLLGSVTAKVLHDADCPVWTGTHLGQPSSEPQKQPPGIHTVVCAVDLGPQSATAFNWAAEFAKEFTAALTLVHAISLFATSAPDAWPVDWQSDAIRYAEQQLDDLRKKANVDCPIRVIQGSPAFAIRETVKEARADLLVIGRSSRSGLMGRLGSEAYGILCHSPSPVVSV